MYVCKLLRGYFPGSEKGKPSGPITTILWERVCRDITSCGGQSSWHGFRPTDLLLPAGWQWPRAGGDGQVTSFFLPGMSAAGEVTGRMARCQKQPFRCVKKEAQLGEAAHRVWQGEEWGQSERLPNKQHYVYTLKVLFCQWEELTQYGNYMYYLQEQKKGWTS